jgi:hypothetical protein
MPPIQHFATAWEISHFLDIFLEICSLQPIILDPFSKKFQPGKPWMFAWPRLFQKDNKNGKKFG